MTTKLSPGTVKLPANCGQHLILAKGVVCPGRGDDGSWLVMQEILGTAGLLPSSQPDSSSNVGYQEDSKNRAHLAHGLWLGLPLFRYCYLPRPKNPTAGRKPSKPL